MNLQVQSLKIKSGNSYIAVSPASFRVSSTALSWTSTNSSMTSDGTLTTKNAQISGRLMAGTKSSGSYIDIYNGQMNIYFKNTNLGFIGGNAYAENANAKGIVFDLNTGGYYMSWAAKRTSSDTNYIYKLVYASKAFAGFKADTVNVGCNFDMHGHTIVNPNFEGTGITGTFTFQAPINMASDGTANTWKRVTLKFQNGIVVKGTSI